MSKDPTPDAVEQPVPYDAFMGGARVLSAIKAVLACDGPIEQAIDAGERALLDLRPSALKEQSR